MTVHVIVQHMYNCFALSKGVYNKTVVKVLNGQNCKAVNNRDQLIVKLINQNMYHLY